MKNTGNTSGTYTNALLHWCMLPIHRSIFSFSLPTLQICTSSVWNWCTALGEKIHRQHNYFTEFNCYNLNRGRDSLFKTIHAWLSLLSLIIRTLYLSIAGARVNEESQRLVPFIRSLPTSMVNVEVQRFTEHLTVERVAISGMKFFTLTKSLILTVGI